MPIGKSKMMMALRETIERLSKFTMPVLIEGDSGSGKHHLARALHKTSLRKEAAIVELSAYDFNRYLEQMQESALLNLLRQADLGTLVIANIEQLNLDAQTLLLDLVSHRPLSLQPEKILLDIRLISLSRGGLEQAVEGKQFREDLYSRLKVMPIQIPALRQHTEDIPELLEFFVNHFVTRDGLEYRHFHLAAQNILRQYTWPGNLKELQNLVQRLLILGSGEIGDDEVRKYLNESQAESTQAPSVDTSVNLKEAKDRLEAAYLSQLLRETGGNVAETAKRSGIDRTNLYRKLKSLGIDPKNPL